MPNAFNSTSPATSTTRNYPLVLRKTMCAMLCAALGMTGVVLPIAPMQVQAATELPDLGEASSVDLPPRFERRLGDYFYKQALKDPDLMDDPDVVAYLNRLAGRLVSRVPGSVDIEVFGVRDRSINAFAWPGGYIGVHSGLLYAAQSESELAAVIGHEIGHVRQRHIARSFARDKQDIWIQLATIAAAIAASRSSNSDAVQAAVAVGSAIQADRQLAFSVAAEREADRVGLQMLTDSGFDPQGAPIFFGRLGQASRFNEGGYQQYVRTHPLSIERMSDLQNRVRGLPTKLRPDSTDFALVRIRARVLQETTTDGLRAVREQFLPDRASSAQASAAAHFGRALVNTRIGEFDAAKQSLDAAARTLKSDHSLFATAKVELLIAQNKPQEAIALAKTLREKYPDSRALSFLQIKALGMANQPQEAVALAKTEISQHRSDPRLYALAAENYSKLNDVSMQQRYTAESYALRGEWAPAIGQLEMARRNTKEFFEGSQIDVRINAFKAAFEDERDFLRRLGIGR